MRMRMTKTIFLLTNLLILNSASVAETISDAEGKSCKNIMFGLLTKNTEEETKFQDQFTMEIRSKKISNEISDNANLIAVEISKEYTCSTVEKELQDQVKNTFENLDIQTNDENIKAVAKILKKACDKLPYK